MPCPDFEAHYPDHVNPEVSWVPSKQPTTDSDVGDDDNLAVDEMGDGRTLRFNRRGDSVEEFNHSFRGLSQADKAAFRTFIETAAGEEFELIDNTMDDDAFVVVVLTEEGVRRRWRYRGGQKWDFELVTRKVRDSTVS